MKLAILDLYDGMKNQGMRAIQEIVQNYEIDLEEVKIFDVRQTGAIPDLSFDIFIFTGGPGSPFDGADTWGKDFGRFLDELWAWNLQATKKKYAFFICHSFQMVVNHFELAKISKRRSKSFGTFPVHQTIDGQSEVLFQGLPDPFYVADFRDFQATEPNKARFEAMGARIIAIEKYRPYVNLERAIMGVRLSKEMIAVQFHPEADVVGMTKHFTLPEQKAHIIKHHGSAKYHEMIAHLSDENKIGLTHDLILPRFLKNAIQELKLQK